jgi:hypothetical protein
VKIRDDLVLDAHSVFVLRYDANAIHWSIDPLKHPIQSASVRDAAHF